MNQQKMDRAADIAWYGFGTAFCAAFPIGAIWIWFTSGGKIPWALILVSVGFSALVASPILARGRTWRRRLYYWALAGMVVWGVGLIALAMFIGFMQGMLADG